MAYDETTAVLLRDSLAKPAVPTRTSWDIGADLEVLAERIAEAGGELTPEMETALDGLETEFLAKCERIYLYAKDCQLDAQKAGEWEAHYAEQKGYFTRKATGLKGLLLAVMARYGRDKIQTPRAKFGRILGQPKYRWSGDTYEQIPERFRKVNPVVYSLNLEAVKQAVANGETLPPEITVDRDWFVR